MFTPAETYLAAYGAAEKYNLSRLKDATELTVKLLVACRNGEIVLYGHTINHASTNEWGRSVSVWKVRPRGADKFVRVRLAQLVAFLLAKNW